MNDIKTNLQFIQTWMHLKLVIIKLDQGILIRL